jgi:succinate dehydrogenase / fumarate reductase, cytochrome b subunit
MIQVDTLPKAFVWRRLHSLLGLWLVLFLMEHLLTNSQAAFFLGDHGKGFVRMVNTLHNLPYLQGIEMILLGIPLGIHLIWGIRYLLTAKYNSFRTNGSEPFLRYARNSAYTWQRITSWILLIFLTLHIVKFRFLEYPQSVNRGLASFYCVKVTRDKNLASVAERLGVTLYDRESGDQLQQEGMPLFERFSKMHLRSEEVMAIAPDFGTASLLTVRNTFKNPYWAILYTIFVLSACFHAFNGLWTFLLTWGWVIKISSQKKGLKIAMSLMLLIVLLGLSSVWGSYFLNLKR